MAHRVDVATQQSDDHPVHHTPCTQFILAICGLKFTNFLEYRAGDPL